MDVRVGPLRRLSAPKSEGGAFGLVLYGWDIPLEISDMNHHAAVKSVDHFPLFLRRSGKAQKKKEYAREKRTDSCHFSF